MVRCDGTIWYVMGYGTMVRYEMVWYVMWYGTMVRYEMVWYVIWCDGTV